MRGTGGQVRGTRETGEWGQVRGGQVGQVRGER